MSAKADTNALRYQFKQEEAQKVLVTNLTYVRVASKWHYVCLLLDLFNAGMSTSCSHLRMPLTTQTV